MCLKAEYTLRTNDFQLKGRFSFFPVLATLLTLTGKGESSFVSSLPRDDARDDTAVVGTPPFLALGI